MRNGTAANRLATDSPARMNRPGNHHMVTIHHFYNITAEMDIEKQDSGHCAAGGGQLSEANGRISMTASSLDDNVRIPRQDVPLMDLDNGLVGWESTTDSMNPQFDLFHDLLEIAYTDVFLGIGPIVRKHCF